MNSNMMEMDPLSYEQYSSYQSPYLPQTQPNIPHTQPNIPHTQPNIPHTQPNIPHPQPTIPHTEPNIHTQSNIPHSQPNIPHSEPNIHTPTNLPDPNLSYPYRDYYPNPYSQNIACHEPMTSQDQNNQADQLYQLNGQTDAAISQSIDQANIEEDIKPDIKKIKRFLKRARILKGKTSSYWNKKIKDKDFKFYGCSICNIAFQELTELDSHVTIHSNRITSYDIRVQNLKKRKRLKKEKKKKKKDAKVKKEIEIDIKPEDGYIGTETAAEFNNDSENKISDCKNERSDDKNGGQNEKSNGKNKKSNGQNEKGDDKNKKSDAQNEKSDVKNEDNDGKDEKSDDKKENGGKNAQNGDTNEKSEVKKTKSGKNEVYKCFACNKEFALSYYLKIHVRSHTDEKPYICNCCGESFITASKLGRHNKRIHLAIRHQCRICFQSFNRFELLTKHFDKKHAEHKLEGEPYDYNAILPYLTELEEQFKYEDEKKPKTEPCEDQVPNAMIVTKLEETKIEQEDYCVPAKFEFADNTFKEKVELEIKCEPEDQELAPEPAEDPCEDSDAVEDMKEERLAPTDDEDEYFPPEGWARSPPPDSPPPPTPPLKGKGAGACELCNRSFSSKSYLKVHMRTHTGEKPFSCYVCGRGFITASKMHRHVLTHDGAWLGEDGVKPEGADIKSEDEDTPEKKPKRLKTKIDKAKMKLLKKPFKKMDPETKKGRVRPHCCEYCGKKFLHIETLQVHKKSHDGEELIIRCNFCLEPQLDYDAKAEHEAIHTGPKPYHCTLCGRNYKDKGAMVYHRKNHKPSDEKLFICDICSKRFNSQAKLARHIVTHSSEKFTLRYECPVCANMFHTRWHVQMHLKSHQKEGLILEENRNAVLAMVLQNARKIPKTPTAHPSGLPPAQPPAPNPLLSHPPDERSRICNICGQVFQHFYYLEEHLKTHGNKIAVEDLDKEEEKKYTCQVCSKSFKLHYYLKLHSFTHTKEKPYICQQCGKGFITKGKLKRHLETHQGLKKYQCHICCKFFTRPSYLRIHVRTIHGTQDYNFRDYGVGVPLGLGGVPLGQITENM